MSPESSEGRERIARMEEKIGRNERQIDMLGPLPLSVALIQRAQDELRDDLKEFRADVDARFERNDRQRQEDNAALRKAMADQNLALVDGLNSCASKVGKLGEVFDSYREAERRRREEERERREARELAEQEAANRSKTERFVAKYGLVGVLLAAVITAGATIINTLIS